MKTLHIMIGCPGSGKSYFASMTAYTAGTHATWISRDRIRFAMVKEDEPYFSKETEVYKKFIYDIAYDLRTDLNAADMHVYADATHTSEKSRKQLIKAIDAYGFTDYQIVYEHFDTPLSTCLKRNAARVGRTKVPEDKVRQMYFKTDKPSFDEDPRITVINTYERKERE